MQRTEAENQVGAVDRDDLAAGEASLKPLATGLVPAGR